jgi:hypothetical protein
MRLAALNQSSGAVFEERTRAPLSSYLEGFSLRYAVFSASQAVENDALPVSAPASMIACDPCEAMNGP